MRWVPSPTDAYSDERLAQAGERAEVLHHRAWAWCGHQETDGVVPHAMVARLCPTGWRARLKSLLEHGVWLQVDGGYRLADWDGVMDEMRALARRRRADADRQQRKRDRTRDSSRRPSRDSPAAEETRENPPNPPAAAGGRCDPVEQPHDRCRGCGTTPRQLAAAAADAAEQRAAAELADLVERRNGVEWCGDPDCDPAERRCETPRGLTKCPDCHPDLVVGPLPAQRPLAVVGAR